VSPTSINLGSRLRAATAVVALLAAWTAAQASLVGSTPDVCSMSCCIEVGHCCCTPRHASVKVQHKNGGPAVQGVELSRQCPDACATGQFASQQVSRETNSANHSWIDAPDSPVTGPEQPANTGARVLLASPPRAPPLLS
jgi:hypothetical protein